MDRRLLGEGTGLRVSALALGTGRLGLAPDGTPDVAEARRALALFADAGGTLIDLSSAYQGGRAEEVTGDFLAGGGRDAVVLSSKYCRTAQARPPAAAVGNHRGAMRAEVEGSLRRLKTDRIDVYFAHFDDGLTPIDEIMRGFDDLVRAGKIIHAGLSNFPAWRIATASAVADVRGTTPLAAVQLQYNLLERAIEREHLPLARARGLAVLAYSPLAAGQLKAPTPTPAATPPTPAAPSAGAAPSLRAIQAALAETAADLGCDPATVAVAWVVAKGAIPIIGPRTVAHLRANLAAATLRLDPSHEQRLDAAGAQPLGYPYDLLDAVRAHADITGPRIGTVL